LVTLCDEIVSMTLYVLGAMDTSAEAMRLEVIDQVGPRGEFVTTEDTLMNFRNTLWFSRLMDRTRYSEWHDTGSKDLRTRLQERTREILETHEPPALEADLRAAIEAVASRRDQ
jgi:trimethylamine--corrinoid protein Co-methyltransferase